MGAGVLKKSAPEGAGAAGVGSTAFSADTVVFTQATPPKLKRASASFVARVTLGFAGFEAAAGAGGAGSGSGVTSSSVSSISRKLRRGVGRCSTGADEVAPATVEETVAAAEDTTPPTL